MNFRFLKSYRLRKRSQFKKMATQSTRLVGRFIIIDFRPNNLPLTRLGITVTRSFGDSHERNRFKRLVREAYRLSREKLKIGFDLNIRPRTLAKQAKTQDIIQDLLLWN